MLFTEPEKMLQMHEICVGVDKMQMKMRVWEKEFYLVQLAELGQFLWSQKAVDLYNWRV